MAICMEPICGSLRKTIKRLESQFSTRKRKHDIAMRRINELENTLLKERLENAAIYDALGLKDDDRCVDGVKGQQILDRNAIRLQREGKEQAEAKLEKLCEVLKNICQANSLEEVLLVAEEAQGSIEKAGLRQNPGAGAEPDTAAAEYEETIASFVEVMSHFQWYTGDKPERAAYNRAAKVLRSLGKAWA